MPFLDDTESAGLATQQPGPTPERVPSMLDLANAAYRTENVFGSAAEFLGRPKRSPFDPLFDPYTSDRIRGYENELSSFMYDNSEEDMKETKRRIDKERVDRDTLRRGGATGLLMQVAMGLADPLILLPMAGGPLVAIGRTGRTLEAALRVGGASGAVAAAQESVLQATQLTRPIEESALVIGGATFLGGVLGAAVGRYGKPLTNEVAETVLRDADVFADEVGRIVEGGSASAAAVRATSLLGETTAGGRGFRATENVLSRTAPTWDLATSPALRTRQTISELADMPLATKAEEEFIPAPVSVERRARMDDAPLAEALVKMDDMFVEYRKGRAARAGDLAGLSIVDLAGAARRAGQLNANEFMDAVGKALWRGDVSDIPQVAEAARTLRQKVIEPLLERAERAGHISKDIPKEMAPNLFTRLWNVPKITAQRTAFEAKIANIVTRMGQEAAAKVARATAEQARLARGVENITERLKAKQADLALAAGDLKKQAALQREVVALTRRQTEFQEASKRLSTELKDAPEFVPLERLDIEDIARQITDHITSTAFGRVPYETLDLQGRMRGNRFPLLFDNTELEEWLETDARQLARAFTRTMAPDVALAERFGRADMTEQFDNIRENYAQLRKAAKTEREQTRLQKRMERDLRVMQAVRDRIRGTYMLPTDPSSIGSRAFNIVQNLNYLRLLGSALLPSFADAARPVMVHGLTNVFKDGIVPLINGLEKIKLSANEAKLAGNALEMIRDTRIMAMHNVMEDYGRWTKYERGMEAATRVFGTMNLLSPWTSFVKQWTAVMSQNRTLRAVEQVAAGKKLTKTEQTRLAHLGIGPQDAERIAEQFRKYGQREDVLWANTSAWDDDYARTVYRAALSKELDEIIVTPGQERTLWSSGGSRIGPLGILIGQFKSFSMAATMRILATGLQRHDMATLNGAILSVGIGMLSVWLKMQPFTTASEVARERAPSADTPSGLAWWVGKGVDQSGLTGWLFDVHNIVEKATRNRWGLTALTDEPPLNRYAASTIWESILGPTAGLAAGGVRVLSDLTGGEWTAADTRAVRQMLPFQNLFYLRRLLDEAEEGVNRMLGVQR